LRIARGLRSTRDGLCCLKFESGSKKNAGNKKPGDRPGFVFQTQRYKRDKRYAYNFPA
jgi:hypothetical protein